MNRRDFNKSLIAGTTALASLNGDKLQAFGEEPLKTYRLRVNDHIELLFEVDPSIIEFNVGRWQAGYYFAYFTETRERETRLHVFVLKHSVTTFDALWHDDVELYPKGCTFGRYQKGQSGGDVYLKVKVIGDETSKHARHCQPVIAMWHPCVKVGKNEDVLS